MKQIPWEKPEALERHLRRESSANWKIVCTDCGKIWLLLRKGQTITQIAEEFEAVHPTHRKEIYFASGGQREYRGSLPAIEKE